MRTFSPTPSDVQRTWWVLDASEHVLGRLAAEVARLLRGKHKPIYAPHLDTGDFVIIVNAAKVQLTGRKVIQKEEIRHSGYPGGLKRFRYDRVLALNSTRAVERAVKGMLPHNRLGRAMIKKLKVYEGPDHPHGAQNPQPYVMPEVMRG